MSAETAVICYRDADTGEGRCQPLNGRGDGSLTPGCDSPFGPVPSAAAPERLRTRDGRLSVEPVAADEGVSQLATCGFSATQAAVCYLAEGAGSCQLLGGSAPEACSATGEPVGTLAPVLLPPPPSPPLLPGQPASPLAPGVTIANDPMFVVNGEHKHFWMPTGKLTPLMSWSPSRGTPLTRHPRNASQLMLFGKTFGHGPTQWFGSYVLTADGKEVLRVQVADEPSPSLVADAATGELPPPSWRKLRTLGLWLDGAPLTETHAKSASPSSLVKGLSVRATSLAGPHIGAAPAETVEIVAPGGLSIAISSGGAKKYERESAQVRWAHLNLRIKSALPRGAAGVIAELAELRPISPLTASYLAVPKIVAQHRVHKRTRAKRARLAERAAASALVARELNETTAAPDVTSAVRW